MLELITEVVGLVVGTGMLAVAFAHFLQNENVLIFASGVSNSMEINTAAFEREKNLLRDMCRSHGKKKLIYFSSCSLYDPLLKESPYARHKLDMETQLKESGVAYTIFRLSQVVGNSKSPTIFNFLKSKIVNGEEFELWQNGYRDFIDVDDVARIVTTAVSEDLFRDSTINIASGNPKPILEIVRELEKILGLKAKFKYVPKGSYYKVDTRDIKTVAEATGVVFNDDYFKQVIVKYST